nr:ion channel [Ensifer sp. Root278]
MVATTLISDTPADCRAYGWQTSRMQRVEVISTPKPVLEIFVGTLFLIVVIFVHGAGIRSISRQFNESWVHVTSATPHWRLNIMLAATIAALALLHFAETLIWAVPLYVKEIIPSMRDSYYYVLESYTTLGEGSVTLPDRWRLLGPIIAMSGLFTFGWTGSVLVSIMTDFGRFDRLQARQERTDEDKAES